MECGEKRKGEKKGGGRGGEEEGGGERREEGGRCPIPVNAGNIDDNVDHITTQFI